MKCPVIHVLHEDGEWPRQCKNAGAVRVSAATVTAAADNGAADEQDSGTL